MTFTQKALFDKVNFLKYTAKKLEEERKVLTVNAEDHAANVDIFNSMLEDVQKSLRLLRLRASVVSMSVYKDMLYKQDVIGASLNEAISQLKTTKQMLTLNEEKIKNNNSEIAYLEKELNQFGRLYEFP